MGSILLTQLPDVPGADFEFIWSNGKTTQDIYDLEPGEYGVTITENNSGCFSMLGFELSRLGKLPVQIGLKSGCWGSSTGNLFASTTGGQAPYNYSWYEIGFNPLTIVQVGGNQAILNTDLSSGHFYIVEMTDDVGCVGTGTTPYYSVNSFIVNYSVAPETICAGETATITLDITGNENPITNYKWKHLETSQAFNTPLPFFSGAIGGTWVVTATDSKGCQAWASVFVEESNINIEADVQHPCTYDENNGSINLVVNGGMPPYSFEWSNGNSNSYINALEVGSYSVTVVDDASCTSTASFVVRAVGINVLDLPQSLTDPCLGQDNGQIDPNFGVYQAEGAPWTFSWSNGDTDEVLEGIGAGTYCLTVTNSFGCTGIGCWTLVESPVVSIANLKHVSECYGSSCDDDGAIDIEVSGAGPFSFLWSNGQQTEDISDLPIGEYSITVTNLGNGCTGTVSAQINNCTTVDFSGSGLPVTTYHYENFEIEVNQVTSVSTQDSNDGAIDLLAAPASPGLYYFWAGPNDFQASSQDITGLAPGKYCVTVTNGCQDNTLCQWVDYCGDNEAKILPVIYKNAEVECLFPGSKAYLDVQVSGILHYPQPIPAANYDWGTNNVTSQGGNGSWPDGGTYQRRFSVSYAQATQNSYGYSVEVTDNSTCTTTNSNLVYIDHAPEQYEWRIGDMASDVGPEAFAYFQNYVQNSNYNFPVDDYIKGCRKRYECQNVVKYGNNTGLRCFTGGEFFSSPVVYDCKCDELPTTINIACNGDGFNSDNLPDVFAYNAQLITSYIVETSQCGRRELCLYYEPGSGPFIFSRDFVEQPCNSGGTPQCPYAKLCIFPYEATTDDCVLRLSCFEDGCHEFTSFTIPGEIERQTLNNLLSSDYIIYPGQCGEDDICTCEELAEIPEIDYCPHCLVDEPGQGSMLLDGNGSSAATSFEVPSGIDLKLFPNPFNSELNIVITSVMGKEVKIAITNSLSEKVWEDRKFISQGKSSIVWSPENNLAAGIYFVQVVDGEGNRVSGKAVLLNR